MKQDTKEFVLSCLFFLIASILFAQENTEKLSSITLNIAQAKVNEKVSETNVSALETKVENIITESGIGSSDYNNNFVIEPKFIVTEVQRSAGGMRSIVIADCSFSLTVKQQNSGSIFSQFAKTIKGSGTSDEQAITNAISQIDPSDEKAVAFVAKAKDKIIAYYKQNCAVIMQKAEKERTVKNYESSLSLLLTIPEEADGCYGQAQTKAKVVFAELQKYNCGRYLQEAKAYAAGADYENALQRLSWIDPATTCSKDANALIKQISGKVDAYVKKKWEYTFKVLEGQIAVEKAQYQVMNNLTMGWLMNQSRETSVIIR